MSATDIATPPKRCPVHAAVREAVYIRNMRSYSHPRADGAFFVRAQEGELLKREVNVSALYSALESKRDSEGISWRELAREIGVNHSIFTRLSKGHRPDVDTFVTLTGWLGLSPERFVEGDEPAGPSEETMEVISTYLRADRSLQPKSAQAIESVLRAAYEQLAERDGRPSGT